jgi:chloramphenicol O-acetyltransferase type A
VSVDAPVYLDVERWPRRAMFEHFRGFDHPYFNVCARLDVAALKAATAAAGASFSLACHHIALRLANQIEPFRYRFEGGRVRIFATVHGSTTVLRDDESFGFAGLEHDELFSRFAARGAHSLAAARARQGGFEPHTADAALMHFTTLPWVHFSSFTHARRGERDDAVPKVAFGRIDSDGDRRWMPISVEVHHALMDGLHVGRYLQQFEAALQRPGDWLAG